MAYNMAWLKAVNELLCTLNQRMRPVYLALEVKYSISSTGDADGESRNFLGGLRFHHHG